MEKVAKDLQNVTKALKALVKEVEKIQKQAAKPVKKAAPKAKAAKKAPVRKAAAKKPAAKKGDTAIATVSAIINRTKKGVDTAALMKKTGFNKKKIANLVFKLKQQGKIKSVEKGVYVKV